MTRYLYEAVDKLARYAFARNRAVDHEVRTIEITDDDAVVILAALGIAERERS